MNIITELKLQHHSKNNNNDQLYCLFLLRTFVVDMKWVLNKH